MQSFDDNNRVMNIGAPVYLSIIDAVRAARKELEKPEIKKVIITKTDVDCGVAEVKSYR